MNQQEENNKTPVIQHKGILSKGYGIMPRTILEDTRLKDLDIRVYGLLQCFAGKDNHAFPGLEKLGQNIDKTISTVSLSIKRLCDFGYVQKQRRGLGKTNIYLLPMDKIQIPQKSKIQIPQKSKIQIPQKSKILNNNNPSINNLVTTTTTIDTNAEKEPFFNSSSCDFGEIFNPYKNKILQELIPLYGVNKVILYSDVLSFQYNGRKPEKPFNLLAAVLKRKDLTLPEGYATPEQKAKIKKEMEDKKQQEVKEFRKQEMMQTKIEDQRALAALTFICLPEIERTKIEKRITKEIPHVLRNQAIIRKAKIIDIVSQEYPNMLRVKGDERQRVLQF